MSRSARLASSQRQVVGWCARGDLGVACVGESKGLVVFVVVKDEALLYWSWWSVDVVVLMVVVVIVVVFVAWR